MVPIVMACVGLVVQIEDEIIRSHLMLSLKIELGALWNDVP